MKQLRERLYAYGSETLLTEELLAIILRGSAREQVLELANRLLVKYGGLGGLLHADCRELSQEQGLGEASIALIKAALEMGKRLHTLPAGDKYQITAPADALNPENKERVGKEATKEDNPFNRVKESAK